MTPRRAAADAIRNGLLFAALIIGTSFMFKIARAMGAIEDPDIGRRVTMIIVGVFLASIGNAAPKMLTPLSKLPCDGATAQALQRFTGWTWVLTGLGFSLVWLVLPIQAAQPLSIALIMFGVLTVLAQIGRACRPRSTRA